jgi:hypothetical protein
MQADSDRGNQHESDGSNAEPRLTRYGRVAVEAYPDSTGRDLKKEDIVLDKDGVLCKVVKRVPHGTKRWPMCTLRAPDGGSLLETHGAVAPVRRSRDLTWQSSLPPALAFSGPVAEPVEEPTPDLLPVTDELVQRVYLPRRWLQEIVDLLAEKRQLIFYGPPGTGKTFLAQRIAEHLTREGGEFELVQFHPSYSYEDFFEGYRPVAVSEGAGVTYELTDGPLRRIAEAAAQDPENPYVLVVDEINRGNLPKIFGELLFLLEYREAQIWLQYSPEAQFGLPKNLYFVGTMNTADRSIALVDAALRRRFYFVAFMPTEEPVCDVLGKWLSEKGLEPRPAQLLGMLNKRIDTEEIAIGPSYLMTADATEPNLERIWKHAIMPVLEEHFYGTGRDIEAEFGLDALNKALHTDVHGIDDADAGTDDASQ